MTKGDKILIFSLIVMSIFGFFFIYVRGDSPMLHYALIKVDGEVLDRIELKEVDHYEYPIHTQYGYNLLEFKAGSVCVKEADCRDQLDVRMGYISEIGQILVCLPHRLTVEIVSDQENLEIDGIAY